MASNDIQIEYFKNPEEPTTGTKPKVYKDGQYNDPLYKKLSKINGEINKLTKVELQGKLKEHGLDSRGLKEVLKKRLKNHYRRRNLRKSKMKTSGKTLYDYLAVIDFEATCDENNPSYRHEIIEFPIVLVDVDKMEIVSKFHEYVKPIVNPKLTKFCTKLTGITQDKVDKADTFPVVLERVETWLQDHQLGAEKSFAVLTDGPWDMFRFMYYQCKESDIEMPAWSKKWVNIRKSYCNFYHCGRGGIEVMLKNLGMKFEGSPHSGIDDSINISRIAIKMLNDGCGLNVNEHIQIKYHPHETGTVSARYEPYKEECVNDSEEEEEDQKKKKSEKTQDKWENESHDTFVNEIEKLTLNDVEKGDDDEDFDDLLTYYKLQKT
ncbi:3'-5' exoribonuclease 1-like [Ruditapes philippinarum]|uniref:3'-5' exoribonuclease 1-like n=1 Tax=Ruditapes philippinarum TaxID=129788 RepID=UPI00295C023E|nr:3'-5' exoribonuclease 1-like [Ruditapes philippinarum]